MRKLLRQALTATVLVAAIGAGAYWYWAPRVVAPTAATPPAQPPAMQVPVEMAAARLGTVTRAVGAIGTLQSNESVVIRPEIAGRVATIDFAEGSPVERGAVLIALDASVYDAELIEAKARLALSRKNFERADELRRRGAGTERALDEADSQLRADEASVALARARLDKMRIVAPFDGVLGLRHVSPGDYVEPGRDIVNLEDIDPIKVDFRIPELHLNELRTGQSIRVEVDAFPGVGFDGEVYAIDPRIDAAGRSILVRARIPNPDGRLRPGLFARVSLLVERRDGAVLVPEQAIMPRGDSHFVFRVVDGAAALTEVTLGQRRAGEVEILDGVGAGDAVVTAGQMKIQDGAPVVDVAPAAGG